MGNAFECDLAALNARCNCALRHIELRCTFSPAENRFEAEANCSFVTLERACELRLILSLLALPLAEPAQSEEFVRVRLAYAGAHADTSMTYPGVTLCPELVELNVNALWYPTGRLFESAFSTDLTCLLPVQHVPVSAGTPATAQPHGAYVEHRWIGGAAQLDGLAPADRRAWATDG